MFQGFDNYLKPPNSSLNKKKQEVTENDRLFSTSSATYQTVSHAPSPSSLTSVSVNTLSFPTNPGSSLSILSPNVNNPRSIHFSGSPFPSLHVPALHHQQSIEAKQSNALGRQ